jgi:hypothetical protein
VNLNKILTIASLLAMMAGAFGVYYGMRADIAEAMETAVVAQKKVDRIDTERRIEKLNEWIRDTVQRWRDYYLKAHEGAEPDTLRTTTVEAWMEVRDEKEHAIYLEWVEEREALNKKLKKED